MKLKLVLNLFLAFVVVLILTKIVQPNKGDQEAALHLFPDSLLEDASSMTFIHDSFSATLERVGHSWEIRRPISATADRSVILRVFSLLENAKRVETITENELKRRELTTDSYGLTKPRASVTVSNASSMRTLWFGDDAPLGNRVYVKVSGSHDIIAITRELFDGLPTNMAVLRDSAAFRGDPARTRQVEIRRPEKPFVKLLRSGNEWSLQQPIESHADTHMVDSMLRSLYELRVRRFISDTTTELADPATSTNSPSAGLLAFGLTVEESPAQIDVIQGDAPAVGILFGKPAPDVPDEIYAKLTSSDSIFTVPKAALDGVLIELDDMRSRSVFSIQPRQAVFLQLEAYNRRILIKRSDSGLWNLCEPMQWPADQNLLGDFLNQLTALTISTFPNRVDSDTGSGEFSPPAYIVQIGQAMEELGERTANRLIIAHHESSSNTVYVKRASDTEVLGIAVPAMKAITDHASTPFYFADRTVMALDPGSIQTISSSEHGKTTTSIRRSEHNVWATDTPSTATVNLNTVEGIIFHAANLRAESIEGFLPADLVPFELNPPARVVTLGLSGTNDLLRSILIGKSVSPSSSNYYACIRGQDLLFILSHKTVQTLAAPLLEPATQP